MVTDLFMSAGPLSFNDLTRGGYKTKMQQKKRKQKNQTTPLPLKKPRTHNKCFSANAPFSFNLPDFSRSISSSLQETVLSRRPLLSCHFSKGLNQAPPPPQPRLQSPAAQAHLSNPFITQSVAQPVGSTLRRSKMWEGRRSH